MCVLCREFLDFHVLCVERVDGAKLNRLRSTLLIPNMYVSLGGSDWSEREREGEMRWAKDKD